MSETTLLKPIFMGATIIALDKFVMKTNNMNESLYFGAAGAIGVYGGSMLAKAIPFTLPSGEYFDGKTLEMRIAEIGVGAGVGYAINRYALKNDFNRQNMMNKLGVLVAADFIAEYAVDYMQGRKLSFFTQ